MDAFCKQDAEGAGEANTECTTDRNGVIDQIAAIDKIVQILVHSALQCRLLNRSHYSVMASHLIQRRFYDFMQREFCWAHMANEFYTRANSCSTFVRNRVESKLKRHILLFPASGPLE